MNYPKITVITACLNAARTIETTIKSVLDQNYPNLEYIVIDGVSTDGTLDIVNKYKEKITKIVSEPDKGIYDAFNKGIALATGDLIGILNADDFYAPWALASIQKAFNFRDSYDVYFGNHVIIDEQDKKWFLAPLRFNISEDMSKGSIFCHQAAFVSRQTYSRFGIYSLTYSISSDWECMYRFYEKGAKFFPINMPLVAFRSGGVSSNFNKALQENSLICGTYKSDSTFSIDYYINVLKKQKVRNFMRAIGLTSFQYWLWNIQKPFEVLGNWQSGMENMLFDLVKLHK